MRNIRQRLNKLEQLPQFQPPPGPLETIEVCALRQLSDEDLQVMIILTSDVERGVQREISERERAVLAAHNAVRETEAQRVGFKSFAEAERIGGQRRRSPRKLFRTSQ